jgi:acetyl-CoA/propionyl-CoA carboxylase biotin carboxyl carrier protein
VTALLVANRGEIARRIFRTARRMGIRTVAVHSDADASLPFVREADAAVRIGPAPARESYLDADRILAAARESGATLIHPGYGFLAESPAFADAVARAGLRFVGPTPAALAALGDKAQAKDLARAAGVPVLPGHWSEDQRDETFLDAARRIGYPVMVKPVAGGGGIGMQRVRDEAGLRDALAKARRIATASFGDDRLLLERLVERPRHVEVQILADAHGTVTALGERDCSTQRRHQKVLEETPAPSLDDRQRKAIAEAAIAVARQAKYLGAGTVEFAVDERDAFFFLEVNARLQVEHPVTELVWDVDLVEQQLRIAQGERLALGEPAPRGHAIEARLYAEDVAAGFLPSTGPLLHVRWPDGVRVDAGYEEGNEVTRHYDPLVAKLIAHGPHRKLALAKLDEALASTEILGVRTNLPFLRALAAHPEVVRGKIDTELVAREFENLALDGHESGPDAAGFAESALALAAAAIADGARATGDPWSERGAFRIGEPAQTTVVLHAGAREHVARVSGAGPYAINGHRASRDTSEPHAWTLDGAPAAAARDGTRIWVGLAGRTLELDTAPPLRELDAALASEVAAPMPGVVIGAQAKADQRVRRGDLLFVVEAMKMELRVEAPADGLVKRVLASVGQQVERGQRLAEFEPEVPV